MRKLKSPKFLAMAVDKRKMTPNFIKYSQNIVTFNWYDIPEKKKNCIKAYFLKYFHLLIIQLVTIKPVNLCFECVYFLVFYK
jgi:hypothetical protein